MAKNLYQIAYLCLIKASKLILKKKSYLYVIFNKVKYIGFILIILKAT